jgi:hypothetical protein
MIIIARQREASKSRKVRKDLNSILTKWNWDGASPKTSQEFLAKFAPWVSEKIKLGNEVKALLERKGATRLEDIE